MFELPRDVIEAGKVVVEKGEIREVMYEPTLCAETTFDEGAVPHIKKSFSTIQFANYPVDEHYLAHGHTKVPCRR
jgi:formylmethanofuran dehydrogenase subunit A